MKLAPVLAVAALAACGRPPAPATTTPAPAEPAWEPAAIEMAAEGERFEIRIEAHAVTVVAGGEQRDVPDRHGLVDLAMLRFDLDEVDLTPPYALVLADAAPYGRLVAVIDDLAAHGAEVAVTAPPVRDEPAPPATAAGSTDAKDWPIIQIGERDLELRGSQAGSVMLPRSVADVSSHPGDAIDELTPLLAHLSPFPSTAILVARPDTPGYLVNRALRSARQAGIPSLLFGVKTGATPGAAP